MISDLKVHLSGTSCRLHRFPSPIDQVETYPVAQVIRLLHLNLSLLNLRRRINRVLLKETSQSNTTIHDHCNLAHLQAMSGQMQNTLNLMQKLMMKKRAN